MRKILVIAILLVSALLTACKSGVSPEEAAQMDWVEIAFGLVRELETKSSVAYLHRNEGQAVDEWKAWAQEWAAKRREADVTCRKALNAGLLSENQKAAYDAIEKSDLLLSAYRALIVERVIDSRQIDLRKENLTIARSLVNEALRRAAPD